MTRRSIHDVLQDLRSGYRRVDPAGAATLHDEGGWLVDIRPAGLRQQDGEIPDAVIIDRNKLEWRLDPASPNRLAGVDDSTYDRPLVVICEDGYASTLAVASLRALGLRGATDMVGGFNAWAADGRPVTPSGS